MKSLTVPIAVSLAVLSSAAHVSTADILAPSASLRRRANPTVLTLAEERDPGLLALAARFNPALALPIPDVWPVEVRYAWHDGADSVARNERTGRQTPVRPAGTLDRHDWSRLPHTTEKGDPLRYYLDAPGDDRPGKSGLSRWRERFAAIVLPQGAATRPAESPYPPTQYVHAYWWNRQEGLLALQYWFYYPFNEWVNHHEGDWEHIEVILAGPAQLDPGARWHAVGHHYFFHDFWMAPPTVERLGGMDPGADHPVVYVGGSAGWFGFAGIFSGGSYPAPGHFSAAAFPVAWLSPGEDTSRPARFIAPHEFQLILLPEPTRPDARGALTTSPALPPALSWLRLPFYVGQRTVFFNPPGAEPACGRPPLQPAARREWLGPPPQSHWAGRVGPGIGPPAAHAWPKGWARRAPALLQ